MGLSVVLLILLHGLAVWAKWSLIAPSIPSDRFPPIRKEAPPPHAAYMVDNTRNIRHSAPDKGTLDGPSWPYSGSFENYMAKFQNGSIGTDHNSTFHSNTSLQARQEGYWLPTLAREGKQPLADPGHVFFINVMEKGAKGNGVDDDSEAINAAIKAGGVCGKKCGNTFTMGAIIYFPYGVYRVCQPIIQYYFSQFIGDPHRRPVIKGCKNFKGIGLIDTDPYIPNENGKQWYINQNQFFRQIRNFEFDLREMDLKTDDYNQALVPTGIHWQVAQATSLQNLKFVMPTTHPDGKITHVGVFTENGSGGFVSDLEFVGGAIGWRAGSQQYTARNLNFNGCITAVEMIWDWGFNWQQVDVKDCTIAFNVSGRGGAPEQGVGSATLIDSSFANVPIGVLTNDHKTESPNIVLDNLRVSNVPAIVQTESGKVLLSGGSTTVALWATGRRYLGSSGSRETGHITNAPKRPSPLLVDGKLFVKSRPQYQNSGIGEFLVATREGIKNDGSEDMADKINSFLQRALRDKKIAYFPAGIYLVKGTVTIPTGSRVQGSSWSQIQGTGTFFEDVKKPQIIVKVGEEGDTGTMEIVEMMVTVKGPTAGAILMQWNVHGENPGDASMWDTHLRVGGAKGSDLDIGNCKKLGYNEKCICASLLLHVTPKSSGYFENVWAWVADHDNDMSLYSEWDSSSSQISLYGGRGMLIESHGPCWFYGTGSEHTVLYQYQLYKAKNIYLGHIQTESPYYQPVPVGPKPFESSVGLFPGDPKFDDCKEDKATCKNAWGLRIVDSSNILIHSAGLYSFFNNYAQTCVNATNCQERIIQVKGSKDVAIFNIFTVGVEEIATGDLTCLALGLLGGPVCFPAPIRLQDNKSGFTTEISMWLPPNSEPTEPDREGGGSGSAQQGTDPSQDWKAITCTHDGVNDAAKSAEWRWAEVRAPAAWVNAIRGFKENRTRGSTFPFPQSISNFFNGPEQMQCHKLIEQNGCGGTTYLQCHDTNHPAGYFILNSFMKLNAIMWNFRSTLVESQLEIDGWLSSFSQNFAPIPEEGLSLAQILDFVLIGWGAGTARMWNKWLKNVQWAKNMGDDYGSLKDFTNDMVKAGVITTKDFAGGKGDFSADKDLKKQLAALVALWGNATVHFASTIHNGQDPNIERLGKMIANGKLLSQDAMVPTVEELKADIIRVLYALLIPMAWRLSHDDINPVVVETEKTCADVEKDDFIQSRVAKGDRSTAKVCLQNPDRAYYLVAARNPRKNCHGSARWGTEACDPFPAAPGIQTLGPNSKWGKITVEDIVVGALNTHDRRKGKNTKEKISFFLETDDDTIKSITDFDIRAAGMIDLPVCPFAEAWRNYWESRTGRWSVYPCSEDALGKRFIGPIPAYPVRVPEEEVEMKRRKMSGRGGRNKTRPMGDGRPGRAPAHEKEVELPELQKEEKEETSQMEEKELAELRH